MTGARILVADDDASMAELLRDLLESWGYEAVCASSVERALACLAGDNFEAVVSDLHMPPRDGFELLAAIKVRWPSTAVVLMSAFPARDTPKRALDAGAVAFLTKPFQLDALRDVLDRVLLHPRPERRRMRG